MNIMILAGAGTSIELGVPAMVGMAREFLVHAEQWDVEPKLVHEIMGKELDIEYLIDGLDRICSAASSLERIGQNTSNLKRISDIRAEVEWFVQHAAERIVPVEAELMWGGVLRQSVNHTLSLITTNYDRAIELAANAVEIQINDGFNRVDSGEHSDWNGFELNQSGVLLAKLHGSTDWYEEIDTNTAIKLRHPMPLFGGARLRVSGGKELGSALVLPSREKLLTHTPYPRLSQTFLNSTDECELAIFIGTSLRDDHLRDAAISTAKKVPVLIVTPQEEIDLHLDNIKHIRQCASTFLISTLPNALDTPDPINKLLETSLRNKSDKGIFHILLTALNKSLGSVERCRALDELDKLETSPNIWVLRELLQDNDPQVARYSLGLLIHSPHYKSLCEEAKSSEHGENDSFKQDLSLLEKMSQSF